VESIYLYSGGKDLKIKQWEISSGVAIAEFVEHTEEISSLQLSDTSLFSASYDPSIKFWSLETRDSIRTLNCKIIR
jgi:WD40 repeat protein